MPSRSTSDIQHNLKLALQEKGKQGAFEKLAATMLSELVGVPVYIASSGFQCGADAGTSGSHGRRLRLECKKYQDTTSLSVRELQGELRQAINQSPDLEAWILAATRTVNEQIATALITDGTEYGVPVIIWEWSDESLPPLAALCATFPDCVEQFYSQEAADLARQLPRVVVMAEIGKIHKELQSWALGCGMIRDQGIAYLQSVWKSPTESKAKLGQNLAGGASPEKFLKRESIQASLNSWWNQAGTNVGPAVMVGLEGTGKTWASLSWLIDRQSDLPIVMIISSATAANLGQISTTEVKRLLAYQLFELTKVRDAQHWAKRLERMLNRPVAEGPVMLVIFDGMNQEPSINWTGLLQVFQGEDFNGRIQIIVSTRPDHYSDKLSRLRGLEHPPIEIPVKDFDAELDGELDQMLAMHMLKREDLHPDLIKFACNPRMFQLVIRFRERLSNADEVTPHRLLWEYGRDTFGERVGKSFTESEWQEWLHEIALELRQGITRFSKKQLATMLNQPDLAPNQIYARLSELIDSGIGLSKSSQQFQPQPIFISHALGHIVIHNSVA